MYLASLLLTGAGLLLGLVFGEREFAGTAEEGARRARMRSIGQALALAGFALLSWIHFTSEG
jgi:hypothetical protein